MKLSRRLALLALATVPAACSSANPTLYVLARVPGTPRARPPHVDAPRVIALRAIAIPHYLERSQIVRSSDGYRMDVLSNEWWGEPLDAMMSRILVQELNQRLPGSTVIGDSGAISMAPDATVEINLQRFDLDHAGAVLMAAQIAVDGKTSASRSVAFTVRPSDGTTSALVAAMSVATGQLADTIAGMLVSNK
ncbi:MAG: PqiC family protein [Pseudomonadota bacterium]|nr:PqiC family protein [Pseudomonadota bacterium]